jgi:hypothetical protein
MNGVREFASGGVQRAATNFDCMIASPAIRPEMPADPMEEETTMLKTISAALVAVSVLAAPALAGAPGKTAQAPANKTVQAPVNKTTPAPVIKAEGKSKALNANARMGGDHKHYRHHRHHKHIGLHKTHAKHIAVKHVTPAAKRS